MENFERQYRSLMWWNRFWISVVATIAIVGAAGLMFRSLHQASAPPANPLVNRVADVITTRWEANGNLRVTIPKECVGVGIFSSVVDGKKVTGRLPYNPYQREVFYGKTELVEAHYPLYSHPSADAQPVWFGPNEFTISARRFGWIVWEDADGKIVRAPQRGTPIEIMSLSQQSER